MVHRHIGGLFAIEGAVSTVAALGIQPHGAGIYRPCAQCGSELTFQTLMQAVTVNRVEVANHVPSGFEYGTD